jgi:hypothetical protein
MALKICVEVMLKKMFCLSLFHTLLSVLSFAVLLLFELFERVFSVTKESSVFFVC